MKYKLILAILFITPIIVTLSCTQKDTEWKGTIEEVNGVTVIKNTEKPKNPDAGRVLQLKEEFRITDESGKYFFRRPRNFQIAQDGNLFVQDNEHLLQFDSEGTYLRDLYKKGQGPGEIENYFSYSLNQEKIYINDSTAVKVIQTDMEGNFIHQVKIENGPHGSFYGALGNWYIFLKNIIPPLSEFNNKLYDSKIAVKLVSKDGKIEKESHVLSQKVFLSTNGRMISMELRISVLSENANILYVSISGEYLLEALDLEGGQILKRFNRKYPRIKHVKSSWEDDLHKKYDVPIKRYEDDVEGLFINKDLIWVKTSTKDEKKGFLIDVFDSEGKYIDNFYLKLDGSLLAAQGNHIFVLEPDEDENLQIVKYKVVE